MVWHCVTDSVWQEHCNVGMECLMYTWRLSTQGVWLSCWYSMRKPIKCYTAQYHMISSAISLVECDYTRQDYLVFFCECTTKMVHQSLLLTVRKFRAYCIKALHIQYQVHLIMKFMVGAVPLISTINEWDYNYMYVLPSWCSNQCHHWFWYKAEILYNLEFLKTVRGLSRG